ncbi:MAG: DNA adenine methylase [Candidatus Thorarchaeota archaeon]
MPYSYETINWNLPHINSRNELRKYVVLKFMEEKAGRGTGELATRYRYNVETFIDGRKLYLIRPAYMKVGFDFQIWLENWAKTNEDKMPSHEDIVQDLKLKKQENKHFFNILNDGINKVFICEDDDRILNRINLKKVAFLEGEKPEVLLKILKWMFIEQDIRYWNYSGRVKLKRFIDLELSKSHQE